MSDIKGTTLWCCIWNLTTLLIHVINDIGVYIVCRVLPCIVNTELQFIEHIRCALHEHKSVDRAVQRVQYCVHKFKVSYDLHLYL